MDITFLGGGQECGKSAILFQSGKERYLFEYGMNVQTGDVPLKVEMSLNGVFISHAHLDHSGFLPWLYKRGYSGDLFGTSATFDIMELLLRDSIKVHKKRNMELPFSLKDLEKMESNRKAVGFNETIGLGSCDFTVREAGHVPGAASILSSIGGKSVLYTGDINFGETQLMRRAFSDYKDVDVLITETTYSYKNHPSRKEQESILKENILEVTGNGGIVMLPSFSVGRTQEMLMLMNGLKDIPVIIDGLGVYVTEAVLRNPSSIRDHKKLKDSFDRAIKVKRHNQRASAIKRPCVIIASAGMLVGGPMVWYAKKLANRQECSMILNGFQVPHTPGNVLLETGKLLVDDVKITPRFRVGFLDFSAHAGRDELIGFIEKTSPGKIILIHGVHTKEFETELKEKGLDAHSPSDGEVISV